MTTNHESEKRGATPGARVPLGAAFVLALAVLASSCASYDTRTRQAFRDFQRGHFGASFAAYADEDEIGSGFLSGAESGLVAFTSGDWAGAQAALHRAAAATEDIEGRALAGTERLAEGLASLALNDTTQAYEGEGFERVYVHCLLAQTYLALGQLDGVWVEVQRANALLEAEEKLYEKSYAAGGLGHFISAVAYEIFGEPDQAYIDYVRMHEKGVGMQLAGHALVRLATRLGRDEDIGRWTELYGEDVPRPDGAANVVVIAGIGTGPFKVGGNLAVPTHDGVLAFSVPIFRKRPQTVTGLRLEALEVATSVRTDVLERVADVAEENLQDRLLFTATKSVVRGVLKREMTKQLEDEYGVGGRVVGDVFSLLTERADLRSWRTLPDSWQACRLFVPPGVHTLELEAIGGKRGHLGTFELAPGETMVVFARTIGPDLYAHPVGGRLIEPLPLGVSAGEAATDALPTQP